MTERNFEIDPDITDRAFQAHLAEFEALRDEIILLSGLQNQLLNYTIAIVAGTTTLFSLGQPGIASQQPILFLVASLLVSAVSWAIVENEIRIHDIGWYIQQHLNPKMQKLIGYETLPEYTILVWEKTKSKFSARTFIKGLTGMGKFAIAFGPSILFIIMFYYTHSLNLTPWSLIERLLYYLAISMAIVVLLSLSLNAIFSARRGTDSLDLMGKQGQKK